MTEYLHGKTRRRGAGAKKSFGAGWLALYVVILASSRPATASAEEPPRILTFYVDARLAGDFRYEQALGAIRAQLSDVDVSVEVERVSGPADVRERLARFAGAKRDNKRVGALWLDLTQPLDVLLFIADESAGRVLVRRIQAARGAEGAALEEVGVIVRSTVGAFLEGRVIGMEAASTGESRAPGPATGPRTVFAPASPPLARTPAPLAEETAREGGQGTADAGEAIAVARDARAGAVPAPVRLEADYVGTVFAPGGGWESGVALSARYVARFHGYVGVGFEVFPESSISRGGVDLHLTRHPVSAALGYEVVMNARLRLAGEAAVVADDIARTADPAPGFTPAPAANRWLWAGALRTRVAWHLASRIWLSAGAGVEVTLDRFTYVISPSAPVLEPLTVRPRVALGLEAELF